MRKRVLLGVLVVVISTTTFMVARQDPIAQADLAVSSPSPSLLDEAEAIAIFENLHDQLLSAYGNRAIDDVPNFADSEGPAFERVRADIEGLLANKVLSRPSFRTKRLDVSSLGEHEISLSQVVVSDGRFFSESGREVTTKRRPELQTIKWTLRRDGNRWLIFDSLIVRSRKL